MIEQNNPEEPYVCMSSFFFLVYPPVDGEKSPHFHIFIHAVCLFNSFAFAIQR